MKVIYGKEFDNSFKRLSKQDKDSVVSAIEFFREHPHHSSLRNHPLHGSMSVYQRWIKSPNNLCRKMMIYTSPYARCRRS
jgi:mRNA-degrading endonuclease YafQ of YafQ-DinJ toxin-antitoxin module